MDKLRWREIDAVYDRMLEVEPNERTEVLAMACGDDEELRREVEKLLDHEEDHSIDGVLNASVIEGMIEQMIEEAAPVKPGQHIKHYVIKTQIGRGGMGEIWQAENTHFDPPRKVAIKVLPPEFADDPERIRRFKREAETVARLNHSNIVTIYDTEHIAGDEGNVHFIVTELIEGQTLRAVMDEAELGWRKSVMIAAQVASALNAAHSVGIIHRDIKPENIMALDHDSNIPGKVLHVKVLDFGIAKLGHGDWETDREGDSGTEGWRERAYSSKLSVSPSLSLSISPTTFTVPGMLMGTPKYMSPEQARGEEPDARTDIFSFGIVLYEMVAGQHPFAGKSDEEILAELKSHNEIPPISSLKTDIPAAVDRLIAKAIRKRREDRYASVSQMQVDIEYLKSLIRLGVGKKEERKLRAQNADQLLTQYVVFHEAEPKTRIPLGELPGVARFASLRRGKLEQALIHKSFWLGMLKTIGLVLLVSAITTALAAYASVTESWKEEVLRDGHKAAVRRAVFSPDGTKLVSVSEDKQVIVWDFAKRERLATFTDHSDWVAAVAFSPDGKWIATASYDKTVIVWDAVKLKKETVLRGHRDKVVVVAFSPDGKTLVSGSSQPEPFEGATLLWRVGSWERFAQIPIECSEPNSILFAAGGRQMIYHNHNSQPRVSNTWDVLTGQPLDGQYDPAWDSNNAVFSPDAALLIGVTGPGEVIFWDFKRRRLLDRFAAHQDNGRAVALSPDGRLAATGSENIILWDVATRRKITTIDYPSIVWSAAFSPDGRWLVSTHGDGGIRVWDVQERQRAIGFNEHNGPVRAVGWARDGQRFASAGEDRSVMIWNAANGRREMLLTGHPTRVVGVAFAPENNTLASVDRDGLVIVWDLAERRERLQFKHPSGRQDMGANCLIFSPDGRVIATSHGVYHTATGQQLADFNPGNEWLSANSIYGLAFSADGARLATANAYGRSVVLDTETWRIIEKVDLSPRQFISVSFAPDGQQLVTGEDGKLVQLWSASPLRPTVVLGAHTARIKSVAFSPDGGQVVSAGDDKTIALWDVAGRRRITNIGVHTAPVYAVAFSPDGKQIVSGGHDHSVRLYTRHRSLWGFRFD